MMYAVKIAEGIWFKPAFSRKRQVFDTWDEAARVVEQEGGEVYKITGGRAIRCDEQPEVEQVEIIVRIPRSVEHP